MSYLVLILGVQHIEDGRCRVDADVALLTDRFHRMEPEARTPSGSTGANTTMHTQTREEYLSSDLLVGSIIIHDCEASEEKTP
jgi:hypothetical protein